MSGRIGEVRGGDEIIFRDITYLRQCGLSTETIGTEELIYNDKQKRFVIRLSMNSYLLVHLSGNIKVLDGITQN